MDGTQRLLRDIFISHRIVNKPFVRRLAGDIEAEVFQDRNLICWVDEAEIRPGQSIPAIINQGLESSRFIGLVMTPAYFASESGWTDAEWHAALNIDPDNRRARIIPLLVEDCPYIPYLLRHLRAIDFRGNRYSEGLAELLIVLREEPLPRSVSVRGQLVVPGGRIDRATLLTERALPQADPDVVSEKLFCNLLPIERLPQYIYTAQIGDRLRERRVDGSFIIPSKQQVKDAIRIAQTEAGIEQPFMPAFRMVEGKIVTFHDLEAADGPFAAVVDDETVNTIQTIELLRDADDRKILISLLNMAIARHAHRVGLEIDETKQGRYFFPSKDGQTNVITWTPFKRKATRTVAKPIIKDGSIQSWIHQGAYLTTLFLANQLYLQIKPTWIITRDGIEVQGGPNIGRLIIKWTGSERNLNVLYHVRFWSFVLKRGPGPISIWTGDQIAEISPIPAWIQQAYGIEHDYKDLMRLLDNAALMIAKAEDEIADMAIEAGLSIADEIDKQVEGEIEETDEFEEDLSDESK